MPKNNQIWVFVGWHKNAEREVFADNSKYLFLHVTQSRPEIHAVWIGHDIHICNILKSRGYRAYPAHSLKGAYYSLRAKHTIIDAMMQTINWRYSGGSLITQLWHADGIKSLRLGRPPAHDELTKYLTTPGFYKRAHQFIASSQYIAEEFTAPSFNISSNKVSITGLPRYDVFFNDIKDSDVDLHYDLKQLLQNITAQGVEKLVLYAPTFRRGIPLEQQLPPVNFEQLNTYLSHNNIHLVISLHPKFAASVESSHGTHSNIHFSKPDFDNYPLLQQFDLVITDYSSICLEFLLLDKPTIFYVYDFDQYKKDPGIPEKFWNLVPGPRVKTFAELCSALSAPDTMQSQRMQVRKILFEFTPGTASENVAQAIENNTF